MMKELIKDETKIGRDNAIFKQLKEIQTNNLNQGVFKGHFYFGKKIKIDDVELDSIVFDDGSSAIDYSKYILIKTIEDEKGKIKKIKEPYGRNQIADIGLNYNQPLIQLPSFFSNESISDFTSSVGGVGSVGKPKADKEKMLKLAYIARIINRAKESNIPSQYPPLLLYISTLNYTNYTNYTSTTPVPTLEIDAKLLGKNLLEIITSIINHYMDLNDERISLLCGTYILSSYCYTLFNAVGYLFLNSEKESGKTKLMDLMRLMDFHPINATNPSEAALFRITELAKGVMHIDDFENIEEDRKHALEQILKVGYKRSGQTIRTEKRGDTFLPVFFDCYCPKIITNTTTLDPITLTRCIPIHLLKTQTSKGRLYPNENEPLWQVIRDLCHLFVLTNWEDIKKVYDDYECEKLNNRQLELSKGLLSIVKTIDESGEYHDQLLDLLAKSFKERDIIDLTESWDYRLFVALRKSVIEKGDWYSTSQICNWLKVELELGTDEDAKRAGKKVPHTRYVGRQLSKVVLFKKRRISGGVQYWLSKPLVEEYMQIKGFEEDEDEEEGGIKEDEITGLILFDKEVSGKCNGCEKDFENIFAKNKSEKFYCKSCFEKFKEFKQKMAEKEKESKVEKV